MISLWMILSNLSQQMKKKNHLLLLPYQGQKGDFALKSMRKRLKTLLPNYFNTQIAFKDKLNSCFKIKDTVNFEHKHDLDYHGKCPANNCKDDYIGETGRRISERIMDHNGKDFVILSSGFRNNTVKRKISEALWIKDLRPTLNRQEKSIELKLFN